MSLLAHMAMMMAAPLDAWTPASLAVPPSLWLNDDSEAADEGGGECSQWNDISGNSFHFTQPNATRQPAIVPAALNGRRVISFDGVDELMTSPGAVGITSDQEGFSIFIVAKPAYNAGAGYRRVINFGTEVDTSARVGLAIFGGNFRPQQRRRHSDSVYNGDAAQVSASWRIHQISADWVNAQNTFRINGGSAAPAATGQSPGNSNSGDSIEVQLCGDLVVGQYSQTEIAEIVCCQSIPGTSDRQKLEGYLAHRWGLAASLPIGHPYKNSPPAA